LENCGYNNLFVQNIHHLQLNPEGSYTTNYWQSCRKFCQTSQRLKNTEVYNNADLLFLNPKPVNKTST